MADNPLAYADPAWQGNPLAARPVWALSNPVGTSYAGASMGMPSVGGFDPIVGMTPQGPMMQSQLDAAHQRVAQAMQTAPMMALGMTGGAPGASLDNPAFAKWFGKSQVVDEAGKPLVVYHGSGHDIPQFDTSRGSQTTGNVTAPWGSFFTPSAAEASRYATDFHGTGQNITPVHLAIENPYEMTRSEWDQHAMTVFRGQKTQEEGVAAAADFKAKLQELGHDGIVVKGRGFNNEYVAFNPTQIKSAIGNRGTFSPTDPRITYGAAGTAAGAAAASDQQQ